MQEMAWRPALEPALLSDGRISQNSKHFKILSGSWIVTWHGMVGHPRGNNTVPPVQVHFSRLGEDGIVQTPTLISEPPITFLDLFRIGSVWDGGVSQRCVSFSKQMFEVSYNNGDWTYTTVEESLQRREGWAEDFTGCYPLKFKRDKTWLLAFQLTSGGQLIVPCLEFFTSMYGFSSELKRILTTYPWHEAEKRLYSPIDDSEYDCWVVSPGPRLVSGDGMFLAWSKYDAYARRVAKSIYSQLETEHPKWKSLKAPPWWRSKAQLLVEGLPLNGGEDFIGLRIKGVLLPENRVKVIMPERPEFDQENAASRSLELEGEIEEIPETKTIVRRTEKSPLTSDELPDHSGSTEVHNLKELEILNRQYNLFVISSQKKSTATGRAAPRGGEEGERVASTDEPFGDGKGVAKAILVARKKFESEGILRDMWNALISLQSKTEGIISVHWYDPATKDFKEGEPQCVEVEPSVAVLDSKKSNVKRWPYFDRMTGQLRGFLVVRIITMDGAAYIIEIQRRVIGSKKISNNEKSQKEESFKGLVFRLDDENKIHEWVPEFARRICDFQGKMDKLIPFCPGEAHAFKHFPSRNESCSCEAATLNALRKIGIQIAHRSSRMDKDNPIRKESSNIAL